MLQSDLECELDVFGFQVAYLYLVAVSSENLLRRALFEDTGGMYPELITRPDIKVFLPPIGGLTAYICTSRPGFHCSPSTEQDSSLQLVLPRISEMYISVVANPCFCSILRVVLAA